MGLFKTLANRFRARTKKLEEDLRDPVADSAAAIEDSEKISRDFQKQIAGLITRNKELERQRDETKPEVKKYERIATAALEAGNEDDARQALEAQDTKEKFLKTVEGEIKQNTVLITQLRSQLNKMRAKIAGAKNNSKRLEARLEGAKIRKALAESASSLTSDGSSPLSALDDLEEKVNTAECEAETMEELAGQEPEAVAASLEEKYGGDPDPVSDKLEKLKAKIGK